MSEPNAESVRLIVACHSIGYHNSSDETWGRNPVCSWCEAPWPCDTAMVAEFFAAQIDGSDQRS